MLSQLTDAAKEGVAAFSRRVAIGKIIGDDPSFLDSWNLANAVPGNLCELNATTLYSALREVRPRVIVEIGSYLGRSTIFMAKAAREIGLDCNVVAVDPHTGDKQQLQALGIDNLATYDLFIQHVKASKLQALVTPVLASSLDAADSWDPNVRINLIYIDGWHSELAVWEDTIAWLPHLETDAVIIYDDYSRYSGVRDAVHALASEGRIAFLGSAFGQAVCTPNGATAQRLERSLHTSAKWPYTRLFRPRNQD